MKRSAYLPLLAVTLTFISALYFSGCGKDDSAGTDATTSASEIAASSAAGAVGSSSGSQGSMAMSTQPRNRLLALLDAIEHNANASTDCPIMASWSGCASGVLTLTYNNCQFQKGNGDYNAAVWNGSQIITFAGGCPASFAAIKTGAATLTRTVSAGTTRTAPNGTVVTLDTTTPSGYGSSVSGGMTATFSGTNANRTITISGIHYKATNSGGTTIWDHSVSTAAPLNLTAALGTGTITSGTIQVQHNLAKYTASAVFSNVTFDHASCGCLPNGGTITSTLTGGKTGTETLAFTGCGTGTLTATDGSTSTITLAHCL